MRRGTRIACDARPATAVSDASAPVFSPKTTFCSADTTIFGTSRGRKSVIGHFYSAVLKLMMMNDDGSLPAVRFIGFSPPRDEVSEVVSRSLPHRQLWVRNLSKVAISQTAKI